MNVREIHVDGVRIAYREAGEKGSGRRPLVLIHGLAAMSDTWQETIELFGAERRVLALDLPGYGASDKPPGDYSLAALARAVGLWLDALGMARAIIVGQSMGGAVAVRLCLDRPELVAGLVLVSPAVYQAHLRSILARLLIGSTGTIGPQLAERIFALGVRSPALLRWRMRVIYGRPEAITGERVATYHTMLNQADCQRAIIATLKAWDLAAIERGVKGLRTPSLIIWGTRDRIIRAHFARRLARDLEGSELQMLPCGHVPQEEMPFEFAALVRDFLDRRGL
jgi:pimeloyl-ACP methyl ester carboxylesterase